MLVLSRRAKEKVSFPELGITIHFVRIQSGTVKIGIDAPLQVRIVRDEISPDAALRTEGVRCDFSRLPRQARHDIRNELHAISVGVHLLNEQLRLGMQEDAESTFSIIQESIERLDENRYLRRPQSMGASPDESASGTVLVVEDEINERELLAGLLRIKGYRVISVQDGREALDYLESHDEPSVILMDMKLPRRDGASVVRQIRADGLCKTSRIFAISGTSPEENGLEIGSAGVDRWFRKPLDAHHLIGALADQPAIC